MRICIVGGIFGKPADYRARHSISPETVLVDGLRQRGWQVEVGGHAAALPTGQFDLVHVHHFGKTALRLALKTSRQPFVLTTHDPFAMNNLPIGWRRRLSDRIVLHRADAVVALSTAERDFLAKRRGLPIERIAVIPNGVNTGVFDRRGEPAPGSADLLFVGQLLGFKGLQYLLESLPDIRRQFPHVRLRIVYQTDAGLESYQHQTERLGLADCVDFAGAKSAAALAQLYSTAAIVVSPSLGECLSSVVLEAMACGAAVIATDVGGIREQLDAETGVIVPPRDSAALSHAISALLADQDRRRQFGHAAWRKVHKLFSVRQMIDRHLRLYEELLETHERAA